MMNNVLNAICLAICGKTRIEISNEINSEMKFFLHFDKRTLIVPLPVYIPTINKNLPISVFQQTTKG